MSWYCKPGEKTIGAKVGDVFDFEEATYRVIEVKHGRVVARNLGSQSLRIFNDKQHVINLISSGEETTKETVGVMVGDVFDFEEATYRVTDVKHDHFVARNLASQSLRTFNNKQLSIAKLGD